MENKRSLNFKVCCPGIRLDQYLAERLSESRSQLKSLIKDGWIRVNGKLVKAGYALRVGDVISGEIPLPEKIEIRPENIELDVVYEDKDLIVVNKPVGMVVHPAAGNWSGTLVNALLHHCSDLSGIGGKLRPGIVHRLDKDTSGLLVVAKSDVAHRCLAGQIKDREVKRHYLAIAQGNLKQEKGTIVAPIARHPVDRKRMAVVDGGRAAVTRYKVKEALAKHTLVECQLETGRTHQIRVHMASIQHPLVGDMVYGWNRDNLGAMRQMLHAYFLSFDHPTKGAMSFSQDPPDDFREILAKARKIC